MRDDGCIMQPSHAAPLAVDISGAVALAPWGRRTVENLVYSGALPSRKIGRRRIILVRDIQRLLERGIERISTGAAEARL